jgi:penicillin-binding protein 2
VAELRNRERELQQFQLRIGIAGAAVLVFFSLLAARFFFLQVLQHDHYASA